MDKNTLWLHTHAHTGPYKWVFKNQYTLTNKKVRSYLHFIELEKHWLHSGKDSNRALNTGITPHIAYMYTIGIPVITLWDKYFIAHLRDIGIETEKLS